MPKKVSTQRDLLVVEQGRIYPFLKGGLGSPAEAMRC